MASIKDRVKTWKLEFTSTEKGSYVFKYNPLEFREVEYGIERNEDDGIVFVFSGDFTYVKDVYDWLDDGYASYGVMWNVTLKLEYIDNHTKQYTTLFENRKVDFSSVTQSAEDGNVYKIPLTDSGFYEKIKARESDDIPYDRLEDLDGNPITPYTDEYEDVYIFGQEITTTNVLSLIGDVISVSEKIYYPTISHSSSSAKWVSTVGKSDLQFNPDDEWIAERNWFVPSNIEGNINGTITINYKCGSNPQGCTFYVYDYKTSIPIEVTSEVSSYPGGSVTVTVVLNVDYDFDKDTRLILQCGASIGFEEFEASDNDFIVTDIKDPEFIEHIPLFQLHDRILTAITGQADSFISPDVFESGGEWDHVYISNGYLYRKYTTEEAQFATSWKQLTQEMKRRFYVSYDLITVGGVKKIICRPKSESYKSDVVLNVANIENNSFNRKLEISMFYSSIIVGTPKKDYEAESGLLSYATQAKYTTYLSIFDNELDLSTEYQNDGNWHERARRLTKSEEETTDSKYDNDIALMETYVYGETITFLGQRTDQDFDTVDGIDTITTPINLNLTPTRCFYRHGADVRVGVEKYLGESIKFNKSDVLTELSTLRSDEDNTIYENEDINPIELDPPYLSGNIIECQADINIGQISTLEDDPYASVQIPDEISGSVAQGNVKIVSTKPIGDSLANVQLYERSSTIGVADEILWADGSSIDWAESGSDPIEWVGS